MGLPKVSSLLAFLVCSSFGFASHKPFSIHDDVLAFPQFDVIFPHEYIVESEAHSRLVRSPYSKSSQSAITHSSGVLEKDSGLSRQIPLQEENAGEDNGKHGSAKDDDSIESYEEVILQGQRFLCGIPRVTPKNESSEADSSAADQEKELARATDRGMELLREMEGRCMYYSAGWWSYSFCYMSQVRQFHARLPGRGGQAYPPVEDPDTHSYVLGRYRGDGAQRENKEAPPPAGKKANTEVAARESQGDSRYLVQYLEGGTTCDLTGKERKVEVQFHCHPQSTDRIGWIKEVATCSYLMAIYTPRLCNDVAFQPPREDQAHEIACREIITPDEVPEWESAKDTLIEQDLLAGTTEALPLVGDIEVGAKKLVGTEGKRIEKGKVAFAGDEKAEMVAQSKGGKYHRVSKEQLKKLKLNEDEVESARKELDEKSEGQDWKLEMIDVNGERGLWGIIDSRQPENEGHREKEASDGQQQQQNKQPPREGEGEENDGDSEAGSDETYKEEL